MQYNNVQNKNIKVKKFIIDSWDVEGDLLNKKQIDGKEKEDILEKDKVLLTNKKFDEVVLERNRQFSFQHIKKNLLKGKEEEKDKQQEKSEIGGLLKTLGK